MKKALLILLLHAGFTNFAQQAANINNYKYVVVPEIFDFQDKKDQYSINTFTKMVFEKYGFVVYAANTQFPDDLALDKCKALYAEVAGDGGFINTDITIMLKDCNGNIVFKSDRGRSKEKDRKKAFHYAFREAAASLERMNYAYNGSSVAGSRPVAQTESITHSAASAKVVNNDNLLTASPTTYGYDLLDKTNKVVIKMYKTTQADYYSAKMETLNGVVFKKSEQWVFEYYDKDDKLISEKLNIKF